MKDKQVVGLFVENISLPPEVEKALDTRTSMGVIGDLSKYVQYQTGTAIGDAARNPGGIAGAGAGMGAGFAMANQMGQTFAVSQQGNATAVPQRPPDVAAAGGPASAPPVLPVSQSAPADWYAAHDGKQAGPFQ